MRIKVNKLLLISTILCSYLLFISSANAQAVSNNSTKITPEQLQTTLPDAVVPELALKGLFDVGVRTMSITNPAQFDNATQTKKDRELVLEVWYPSSINTASVITSYENVTRTGLKFSIQADAYRDASVLKPDSESKYPLVVLSHGYTGYRTLMYYLAEHLASHGYVVASIDHTDSTNAEIDIINNPYAGTFSTLLNRSRDQQFTLNYLTTKQHFASTTISNKKAGLIGYSMGGYGAINTIGGCYNFTKELTSNLTGIKDPEQVQKVMALLNSCAGGQYNLFNNQTLAKIKTPILYVAGDLDNTSGYDAIKSLYEKTGTEDKYLLTYQNARHNIAPHPAPSVAKAIEMDFGHYYESAWDSSVLNNNNKHFSLAMMDCYLKLKLDRCEYLNLSKSSNQVTVDGKLPKPWKGFEHRYSAGMKWLMAK
jgi:dienelactone hydrolase